MPSYTGNKENLRGAITLFLNTPIGKKPLDDYISGKTKEVIVDLDELNAFQSATAQELINNTSKWGLAALEEAVGSYMGTYGLREIDASHISVIGSLPLSLVHEIGADNIGKTVHVHGLINKTASIHPMYVQTIFKCALCGEESQSVLQENPWILTKPFPKCNHCQERTTWEPIPQESEMIDSQEFTLQESYDDILSNKIPRTMMCITFKTNLLNFVGCGDEVDIVAIANAMLSSTRFGKSKFNVIYLEVLSIIKKKNDPEDMVFTQEEEQKFIGLSKDPNAYSKMIDSVAPNLYGMTDEKEGCLLSLFGSSDEKKADITLRGNIHVLLVGDPMTGKSQLLEAIMTLAPKAYFSAGRGTTNAGLTATVSKNIQTGEWEITGGVLVLANNGIACIDEIDKMRDEDRGVIHRAMEQQRVSINKADVHVDMSARTAVIASANPHMGRYDSSKSMIENLPKFPIELFSRFDLIFVLLDNPNTDKDTKLAQHILGVKNIPSPVDRQFLKKYIAFSKRINPTLSDSVNQQLREDYVETRQRYTSDQKQMIFGARQLEGLRRLTLAHARALLKTEATLDDLKVAKRVFEQYLLDIGKDLMGQYGGVTQRETELVPQLEKLIQLHGPISREDLRNLINCKGEDFDRAWKHLVSQNMVMEWEAGKYKLTRPQHTLG